MKIVGIVLLLVGGLWAFQGVGMVGGSFMTGEPTWLYIGVATAIVGVALLLIAFRRPPAS